MVPMEQPQLGWGVTVHPALKEASAASPNFCSIGVQPGGELGLAWGIWGGRAWALNHSLCQGLESPLQSA